MREVRHPLVMFIVGVLAVIALGVGVLAATSNQNVYGPSWGRFTAAFPGRVYETHSGLTAVQLDMGITLPKTENEFSYANQPLSDVKSLNDVRFVSVTTGISAILSNRARLLSGVAANKNANLGPGTTEDIRDANGLTFITLGPQCEKGVCGAMEIVFNRQVLWELLVLSNKSVGTVQGFLDSFAPIG